MPYFQSEAGLFLISGLLESAINDLSFFYVQI